MILLDTNIIYYVTKTQWIESINVEYLEKLVGENLCFCSSLNFFEIINRYKNNAPKFRKICAYLEKKSFSIKQNDYFHLDIIDMCYYSNISSSKLKLLYEKKLKEKIEIDARYTTVLIFSVFVYYIELKRMAYADKNIDISNCLSVLTFCYKLIVKTSYDILLEVYRSRDCDKKIIRDLFYSLLETYTVLLLPHIENAYENIGINDNTYILNLDDLQKKAKKEIRKNHNNKVTICTHIKRLTLQARKNGLDNPDSLISLKTNFTNNKIKSNMTRYLEEKITSIVKEGTWFDKNDIVDRMILDDLGNDDFFITHENDIISFMKRNRDIIPNVEQTERVIKEMKNL